MGATPQNGDEGELYDETEVSEDDFAEFDIDEDEEGGTTQKVKLEFISRQYFRTKFIL